METEMRKSAHSRVLVVDDDEITRHIMQRILTSQGFTDVTLCSCATEGLAAINAEPEAFDIFFLDMNLPEMNALEFVQLFDTEKFHGRLILLSAEAEETLVSAEDFIAKRKVNVLGHLQKPISRSRLIELLAAC